MARIATSRGPGPVPTYGPSPSDVAAPAFQAAALLGQAASAAAEMRDRETALRRSVSVHKATNQIQAQLGELSTELASEPDPDKVESRFAERQAAIIDAARANLGEDDDESIARFELAADELVTEGQIGAQRIARKRRVGDARATTEARMFQLTQAAGSAPDDLTRQVMVNKASDLMAEMTALGAFEAEEAGTVLRKFNSDADRVGGLQLIRDDAEGAVDAFSNPDRFRNLEPKTRESLLRTAETRAASLRTQRSSELDRADRRAERQERQGQRDHLKDVLTRISGGEITEVDEILPEFSSLSAEGITTAVSMLRNPPDAPDDPTEVTGLLDAMRQGDAHSAIQSAFVAHSRGEPGIRQATMLSLLSRNEQRNSPSANASTKRAFEAIDALGPSRLEKMTPQGVANAANRQLFASNDLQRFIDSGNKPDGQIEAYAVELVRTYSSQASAAARSVLPLPYLFVGADRTKIDQAALGAAAAKLKADIQAGRIVGAAAEVAKRNLTRWAEALAATPVVQP